MIFMEDVLPGDQRHIRQHNIMKIMTRTMANYISTNLALQVGGVSRIGIIKYGQVPRDCAGEDQQQK
jgi:hypothetical protein